MSRSGYTDDYGDNSWAWVRWRGAVKASIRGTRGQALLSEMLAALDAMPEKKLIRNGFVTPDGNYCALGVVGKARGLAIEQLDPYDTESVARSFNIPYSLACEIVYINDEGWACSDEQRWSDVRRWVCENLTTQHK